VQGAVGVTEKMPLYSSGYVQPATVTTPPAVSCASSQPFTEAVTELGAAVKVAGGIVIIDPVDVYVGIKVTGTTALDIVVGGHGKEADEEAGIDDVAPPVAHGA